MPLFEHQAKEFVRWVRFTASALFSTVCAAAWFSNQRGGGARPRHRQRPRVWSHRISLPTRFPNKPPFPTSSRALRGRLLRRRRCSWVDEFLVLLVNRLFDGEVRRSAWVDLLEVKPYLPRTLSKANCKSKANASMPAATSVHSVLISWGSRSIGGSNTSRTKLDALEMSMDGLEVTSSMRAVATVRYALFLWTTRPAHRFHWSRQSGRRMGRPICLSMCPAHTCAERCTTARA